MNDCISGVLVRARTDGFGAALAAIEAVTDAEVRWQSPQDGKIVVVLETPDADAACRRIEQIAAIDGVVDASLSYSYNPAEGQQNG